MKRFAAILLLCCACFFTHNLQAQHAFGVRFGFNSATVTAPDIISNTIDFDRATGVNIGVFGEIKVSDFFSFQPELAFIQKGVSIREGFDIKLFDIPLPIGAEAVTKINYLEVPLLAKFSTGGEGVKAYAIVGPSLGYATGGRLKAKANLLIDIPLSNTKYDLDAVGVNRFELGGVLGAGVEFPMGNGALVLDARYQRGFTDVNAVPVVDLNTRNASFGMNIGYMVRL